MSGESESNFEVLRVTSLEDIIQKKVKEIPESDVTIQTDKEIIQLKYVSEDREKKKYIMKPGCFSIEETVSGVELIKFELRDYELLKSIDNTKIILDEADKFFNKLDVYEKLGREPKRAMLVCSPPGVGKTAAINDVCKKFLNEEGTCVMAWDTAALRSRSVNSFLMNHSKFSKKTKKFIFIIEDISGGTTEEEYGTKGVDSSLLNLLDGVGSPFKGIPTLIIATTNNPEREVGALIDRPGRFDKVIELKTPNEEESIELLKFISKKELTEDDIGAARLAAKNNFSIAHLQEIVVRSLLDDVTMHEACHQLVTHKERFKNSFQETNTIGMSMGIR